MWHFLWFAVSAVACVCATPDGAISPPNMAGQLPLPGKDGSHLYYAFWEATAPPSELQARSGGRAPPVLLWLQGGPGCASTFGAFYELGPTTVSDDGKLQINPHAWNVQYGLLVIDQPVGTGYSTAANASHIPNDVEEAAADLAAVLRSLFESSPMLRGRALFIAGESYAGKYVPALADKLLRDPGMSSAEAACGGVSRGGHSAAVDAATARRPGVPRLLAAELLRRRAGVAASTGCLRSPRRGPRAPQQRDAQEDPPFVLSGLIIGSGFTDPIPQTRVLPAVAYSFGMVTESGRGELAAAAAVAVQLAEEGQWGAAAERRTALLQTLQNISGTATLLDVRRSEPYDAAGTVQTLLRTPAAAAVLRVPQQTAAAYESCSPVVAEAMESDVMRSVAHVFANALQRLPVLLYAGMFDAQDGVASTSAWLSTLDWGWSREWAAQPSELWYDAQGAPAGWRRNMSTLTQAMVRGAGHMAPRDAPAAMRTLVYGWLEQAAADWSEARRAADALTPAVLLS